MIDAKRLYAELLRYGVIEIRALENDKLYRARDIANIMHNIPMLLVSENPDWEDAHKHIMSRARACGLEKYINNLIVHIEGECIK